MGINLFILACWAALVSPHIHAEEPDTLVVFDSRAIEPGTLPDSWSHFIPKNQRTTTDYTVVRSIEGPYLRMRSASSGSWLEIDMNETDVTDYPCLAWQWKVDIFPAVEFEKVKSDDDFALRIELVFDFRGGYVNIINVIKKGLITSLFHQYPPELVISYVWAVHVPTDKPYQSPESRRTMVIPIQSNDVVKGRWITEKRDFTKDLELLGRKSGDIVLEKIRIRSDTDNSSTTAESGLRYIYFLTEQSAKKKVQ